MLPPRILIDYAFAEPFRPFQLHMASGRTFQVWHPEMIKIGRSSVTVYAPPEGDEEQAERWQEVSLMLLESVEPLETKTHSGSR
jgi:hypothetical protein